MVVAANEGVGEDKGRACVVPSGHREGVNVHPCGEMEKV